jgi:glutaredoxin
MTDPDTRPTLTVYRRSDCELCDDARDLLQAVLEDRVRHGQPIPLVRDVDIDTDAALEQRYGARVPVFVLGGAEADLVTTLRQVRTLLDRGMGQLA